MKRHASPIWLPHSERVSVQGRASETFLVDCGGKWFARMHVQLSRLLQDNCRTHLRLMKPSSVRFIWPLGFQLSDARFGRHVNRNLIKADILSGFQASRLLLVTLRKSVICGVNIAHAIDREKKNRFFSTTSGYRPFFSGQISSDRSIILPVMESPRSSPMDDGMIRSGIEEGLFSFPLADHLHHHHHMERDH